MAKTNPALAANGIPLIDENLYIKIVKNLFLKRLMMKVILMRKMTKLTRVKGIGKDKWIHLSIMQGSLIKCNKNVTYSIKLSTISYQL